jgi:hypothetical protein
MSANDRAALRECFEIASRDPERAELMREKLKNETRESVARFASFCVQMQALKLRPWRMPPCWCDEDDPHPKDKTGHRLLRLMLAAGVSRYEPDPLTALRRKR